MRKYSKIKNGFRVVVLPWDSVVTITNEKTGAIVRKEDFGDYIKALLVAKTL